MTVGSLVSAYALYRISNSNAESGSDSWISSLISKWTPSQEVFEQRNAIRTALLEKAAEDKHLLQSQGPKESYSLKQPEYVFLRNWDPASILILFPLQYDERRQPY